MIKKFSNKYFNDVASIAKTIDFNEIEKLVFALTKIKKKKGRIFFIGVGGSAGNCSHAVNDFRKLCNLESYAPTDNVSELTARINDEGWKSSFAGWLKVSKLNSKDCIFIMSVGGGDAKRKVSENIIESIKYAKLAKSKIFGIVGYKGGYTKKNADCCIRIPLVDKKLITPYTEAYQAVIWHCIVSHPMLQENKTKW